MNGSTSGRRYLSMSSMRKAYSGRGWFSVGETRSGIQVYLSTDTVVFSGKKFLSPTPKCCLRATPNHARSSSVANESRYRIRDHQLGLVLSHFTPQLALQIPKRPNGKTPRLPESAGSPSIQEPVRIHFRLRWSPVDLVNGSYYILPAGKRARNPERKLGLTWRFPRTKFSSKRIRESVLGLLNHFV